MSEKTEEKPVYFPFSNNTHKLTCIKNFCTVSAPPASPVSYPSHLWGNQFAPASTCFPSLLHRTGSASAPDVPRQPAQYPHVNTCGCWHNFVTWRQQLVDTCFALSLPDISLIHDERSYWLSLLPFHSPPFIPAPRSHIPSQTPLTGALSWV